MTSTRPATFEDALRSRPNVAWEKVEQDWRNRYLDVQGMWCHLQDGGDVFVTSDGGILRKRARLALFGAGQILRPCDALAHVHHERGTTT